LNPRGNSSPNTLSTREHVEVYARSLLDVPRHRRRLWYGVHSAEFLSYVNGTSQQVGRRPPHSAFCLVPTAFLRTRRGYSFLVDQSECCSHTLLSTSWLYEGRGWLIFCRPGKGCSTVCSSSFLSLRVLRHLRLSRRCCFITRPFSPRGGVVTQ